MMRINAVPPTVGLLALAALVALPWGAVRAQGEEAGPSDEIRDAMEALPDLVGRWKGEGWIRRGPGEPLHVLSEEIVEAKLDGQIWVIEGIHHAKEEPSRKVFHAFAVLSYDPGEDTYRFRSHTSEGRGGDFKARVEDGAFVWGHQDPRGEVRYTARIREGRWEEVGEHSSDGETWNQFFEMKLRRVD